MCPWAEFGFSSWGAKQRMIQFMVGAKQRMIKSLLALRLDTKARVFKYGNVSMHGGELSHP